MPTFDTLMDPVIQALKLLGGSGTIEEVNTKATEIAKLSDEQLEILHNPEKGSQTEVEYRLAWARTYLKKYRQAERLRIRRQNRSYSG
jgi:restriction system protein